MAVRDVEAGELRPRLRLATRPDRRSVISFFGRAEACHSSVGVQTWVPTRYPVFYSVALRSAMSLDICFT